MNYNKKYIKYKQKFYNLKNNITTLEGGVPANISSNYHGLIIEILIDKIFYHAMNLYSKKNI